MNKRELIKHIEDLPYNEGLIVDTIKISRNGLLKLIEQLDEPQKVKIPQVIAEYIKQKKDDDYFSKVFVSDEIKANLKEQLTADEFLYVIEPMYENIVAILTQEEEKQ